MTSELGKQSPAMLYGQGDRLAVLRLILKALDQPDQAYQILHLAGTNGKGSTSTMLQALLASHGLRVGLFTSPHLESERESIQVNGQLISQEDFKKCQARICSVLDSLGLDPDQDLSQFEWTFLIAMVYFQQSQCSWVVLECGLGGELDATNAISHADYAIFTRIGLDHLNILGPDLPSIATTKAGIIRSGQRVVIAPHQDPQVIEILKDQIKQQQAKLVTYPTLQVKRRQVTLDSGASFSLDLGLKGRYQDENLTTVLTVYLDWLAEAGLKFDLQAVNQALHSLSLPGRYEKVQDEPVVLMDAAHNSDAMAELCLSLQEDFPGKDLSIVCGFLKDKAVHEMVDQLSHLPANFYLTEPDFPGRTLAAEALQEIFAEAGIQAPAFQDPNQAVDQALAAGANPLVILGSFHLIKRLRRRWVHD